MNLKQVPKQFFLLYKDSKGIFKERHTNYENTALKWKYKYGGEVYIDTRYKAKLRLYWYLWRKNNQNKAL